MSWTQRDIDGFNIILVELRGFVERHRLEITSDLILREAQAERDVTVVAHMLGSDLP